MGKFRPYNWNDDKSAIKMIVGEIVINPYQFKNEGEYISMVTEVSERVGVCVGGSEWYNFADFFRVFTFADGSPCGIEEGCEE